MTVTITRFYNQSMHQVKYIRLEDGKSSTKFMLPPNLANDTHIPSQVVPNDTVPSSDPIPQSATETDVKTAIRLQIGYYQSVDIYETNGQIRVRYPRAPDQKYTEQTLKVESGSYVLFLAKSDKTGMMAWPVFFHYADVFAGESPDDMGVEIAPKVAKAVKDAANGIPTGVVNLRRRAPLGMIRKNDMVQDQYRKRNEDRSGQRLEKREIRRRRP
ncbi:hypothetical protein TWF694_000856 [Orbilia ellipsospora]|uniref:Uncharacterized protein n=1 Tax=Orbilia ellipsospora TaxID=2528407 RepID=A0AAV9XPW2_9PEZI